MVFSCVRLPEINYKATNEDSEQGTRIVKLFRHHPMFVFGLFSLLAYEVAEISINSYFINFVTAKGWMTDNTASIVLTAALAFFMLGRFGGSWIMRTVKAETMLLACATGSVISIGLVLCNLGKLSMIALICNYIFEAIMFPTIFSLSLRGLGNLAADDDADRRLRIPADEHRRRVYADDVAAVYHSLPLLLPRVAFRFGTRAKGQGPRPRADALRRGAYMA